MPSLHWVSPKPVFDAAIVTVGVERVLPAVRTVHAVVAVGHGLTRLVQIGRAVAAEIIRVDVAVAVIIREVVARVERAAGDLVVGG